MFETITPAPSDPILGLTEAFRADTRPDKVNLGVGIFQDDTGRTPVLDAVKAAEAAILASETTKSYLPIQGAPEFARAVEAFVFRDHAAAAGGRARTAHTPGGTGALRVGADFLNGRFPRARVWLSTPTWANHKGVFSAAGFEPAAYAYYDAPTRSLDFDGMVAALERIPAGDVVVLHVCCHNPTGVDPAAAQWAVIADVAARQGWMPFLDGAYLGFGRGIDGDRTAIRAFLDAGVEFLLATAFSKNMSLYRERVGALSLVARDAAAAEAAFSHVKQAIRVLYSNPPTHGAEIAVRLLGDRLLHDLWIGELDAMRERIHSVRGALAQGLADRGLDGFGFIRDQQGMFSFSGLTEAQVDYLREHRGIYMARNGRINVAGLSRANIDAVCDAIAEALARTA